MHAIRSFYLRRSTAKKNKKSNNNGHTYLVQICAHEGVQTLEAWQLYNDIVFVLAVEVLKY